MIETTPEKVTHEESPGRATRMPVAALKGLMIFIGVAIYLQLLAQPPGYWANYNEVAGYYIWESFLLSLHPLAFVFGMVAVGGFFLLLIKVSPLPTAVVLWVVTAFLFGSIAAYAIPIVVAVALDNEAIAVEWYRLIYSLSVIPVAAWMGQVLGKVLRQPEADLAVDDLSDLKPKKQKSAWWLYGLLTLFFVGATLVLIIRSSLSTLG